MRYQSAIAVFFTSLLIQTPVSAATINTGEIEGAYHSKFCPALKSALSSSSIELTCKPSNGSLDNIAIVEQDPAQFGYAQFDILAHKLSKEQEGSKLKIVRDDVDRECLFFVSKNKLFNNFGDISASAPYLNFILPPKGSGSYATFKILQQLDKDGIDKPASVTTAANTQDAITTALSAENNVTLIVVNPDPASSWFKLVNANGGLFIPAISRGILGKEIGGRKLYRAEVTPVKNPKWHKSGEDVITACTSLALFTGKSELITDAAARTAHATTISKIEATPSTNLRPAKGWFAKFWEGSKALSAKSVEAIVETSEKAKKAASPYVKKAKDASEPYVEKAKDAGKDMLDAAKPTLDAAKEKTKEAIEASKPVYEKAKEKTKEAIEASKPAVEKAKEVGKTVLDKAGDALNTIKEKAAEQMKPEDEPENQ